MLAWLTASIDPARVHDVGFAIAWHGRSMVLAWGILLPVGVLAARFYKVVPGQDWPQRVDNRLWWHAHLSLQYLGGFFMLVGLLLVVPSPQLQGPRHVHGLIGYCVIALGLSQFIAGWLRGSKGGPTDASLRGDHYDMTRRRRAFEHLHKTLGYIALLMGCAAVATGLWQANAPRWMWLVLFVWWVALVVVFAILQRRGRAIDTYQAIWGPDMQHPGNHQEPIGWGVRRLKTRAD